MSSEGDRDKRVLAGKSDVVDGAYVHVAMGSLVDARSLRPTEHIFVGSKAPWFEVTDDPPQFEEYRAKEVRK